MRTSRYSKRAPRSRGGFTLIEIMVVLVIASIVTGISITGFSSMSAGNKRTSCQTNLSQIYNALRLYMNDEAGKVPPFDVSSGGLHTGGIGLWALYTFQSPGSSTTIAPVGTRPIQRYLHSAKSLHCPADFTHQSLYTDSTESAFNPEYLSYGALKDANGEWPYQPLRVTGTQRRQLDASGTNNSVPPSDDTVVTWCPYHRYSRDYDEVLFFDGTVQYLPSNTGGSPLWQRVPASQ